MEAVGEDHAEKWRSLTIDESDYEFMSHNLLFNGDNYPQYPCKFSIVWAGFDQSPDHILNSYYSSSSSETAATITGGGSGVDNGLLQPFSLPNLYQQPILCPGADLLLNYDENILDEAYAEDEHEEKKLEAESEDQQQYKVLSKKRSSIQVDVQNKKRNTKTKKNKKLGCESNTLLEEDDSINTSIYSSNQIKILH